MSAAPCSCITQEMMHETMNAQLLLLKSQFTPHVLLNSLNGIAQLIRESSPHAETSVIMLAQYYRSVLNASEKEFIPLKEERALMESYLNFESFRLENKLKIEWQWDHALDHVQIPPLLFQPLIENAITNGVAKNIHRSRLRILLECNDLGLRLATQYSSDHSKSSRPSPSAQPFEGVSENLNRRLKLVYGEKASHSIINNADWITAEILICRSE